MAAFDESIINIFLSQTNKKCETQKGHIDAFISLHI